MASEIVNLRKNQVDMDKMAADMVEMKQLMMSLRPSPQPGVSLGDIQPEVSNSGPVSSLQDLGLHQAAGGLSIQEDVAQHIQKNTVPPTNIQTRGEYTGPTIADLRKDENVSLITQQVLAALEQRIPQIREHFSSPGSAV